jgi:hypothetical protein
MRFDMKLFDKIATTLTVVAFIALGLYVVSLAVLPAASQYVSKVHFEGPDKFVADTGGVISAATGSLQIAGRTMYVDQYSADPNATSATATISTIDADDLLVATMTTANATAYLLSAEPFVGGVTLTWSADPQASVDVTIVSFQD